MSRVRSAAVVANGQEGLALEETELEAPGPMELVVETKAAGLCHTDLDAMRDATSPFVLGHEGAGIVVAIGSGVQGVGIGDHVLLTWAISCGSCFTCVAGMPVHCERLGLAHGGAHAGSTRLGMQPLPRFFQLGTMAELAVVRREAVVVLPRHIPFDLAAILGCGVMTGFGSVVNVARVEPGSSVAVIGCGGVGLSAVQGARIAGAATVVALDVDRETLSLARELGATHTLLVDPADRHLEDAAREVLGMAAGRGVDYAFECTGLPRLAASPLRLVRHGGTAVQVSGVEQTVPIDMELFEWDKRYICPLYGACRPSVDFPRLVRLWDEGQLLLDPMVSRRYTLSDHAAAFGDLERSLPGKGVLRL